MKTKLSDIPALAQKLLETPSHIFTFSGSLGAGKTTLVQHMLKELGVSEPTQSPTYTYVCSYTAADGRRLYHFDLYRLNSLDEFIQAGFDEYLHNENALCLIEWPEIIKPLLDDLACNVHIEYVDAECRDITIK